MDLFSSSLKYVDMLWIDNSQEAKVPWGVNNRRQYMKDVETVSASEWLEAKAGGSSIFG